MRKLHQSCLIVIGVGSAVVGLWAQAFPRSFYDNFPGLGRIWVAVDGPYNEHLVRDVGGLNLALAFVAIFALITASPLVARAAGGAALIFGLPHLIYHATHLDGFASLDKVAMIVALVVSAQAGFLVIAVPPVPEVAPTRRLSGDSGP